MGYKTQCERDFTQFLCLSGAFKHLNAEGAEDAERCY